MPIELPADLAPSPERRAVNERTRVVVGLSGGVDSSVSALLLAAQGYRVEGVFMQNWEDDDEHCTARQDYRDAAAVAARVGIPLSAVNFADEYWERVFAHFLAEYGAGRTPNPDILCNREIKFRAFLDHARRLGADRIATGHYVRRGEEPASGAATLLRGLDVDKDQSYFLHALDREQIGAALFPVGALDKPRVRRIAREAGFAVAAKKDSTGICFIGERKFQSFLAEYLPARPGDIVTESGDVVGRHSGLMFHTLGQRQGLGIGGRTDAGDAPWYVLEKRLDDNRLVVGQGHDHPALLRTTLRAHGASWIDGRPPAETSRPGSAPDAPATTSNAVERIVRCTAKVRYRQDDVPCAVTIGPDATFAVRFDEPVRAITPGQSVVLYDGERCLGGGVIGDLDESVPEPALDRPDDVAGAIPDVPPILAG